MTNSVEGFFDIMSEHLAKFKSEIKIQATQQRRGAVEGRWAAHAAAWSRRPGEGWTPQHQPPETAEKPRLPQPPQGPPADSWGKTPRETILFFYF